MKIKNILKFIFWKLFNLRKQFLRYKYLKNKYGGLSNKEIFTKIYVDKVWNKESTLNYDSGPGSHEDHIVIPYVSKIKTFLNKNRNLIVIDLGCGDFNVGSKIYKYTKRYIAIDVVSELIERNKKLFISENLIFKSIDATNQKIPNGDLILIKEVFQHITNKDIKAILKKTFNFKYIIVTESEPLTRFKPNIDKLKGHSCRTDLNSGIVLDKAPFNLKYKEKRELMKIKKKDRYITTVLYIK